MTLEVLRQFMTLTISTDCPPRSSTAPQHHPGHQHSKSNCLRSIKKTLHQAIRLGGFLSPFPSGLRLSAGMTCPPVKSMLRFVGLMATERTLSAWTSAGAVATKSSVAAGGCPSWPHQAPRTDKLGSQQPSPQLMQRRSGKETKWSAKTRRTSPRFFWRASHQGVIYMRTGVLQGQQRRKFWGRLDISTPCFLQCLQQMSYSKGITWQSSQ